MSNQVTCTAHFLTIVAKDSIVRTFGSQVKNWPAENWWMMVSSAKESIKKDQLPAMMKAYNIDSLPDIDEYFDRRNQ